MNWFTPCFRLQLDLAVMALRTVAAHRRLGNDPHDVAL
jgi:hypothetical protein